MVHRLSPAPMVPHAEYLASLPRKRVIASALIVAEDHRVLCIEPTYKGTWHLPGGTVERRAGDGADGDFGQIGGARDPHVGAAGSDGEGVAVVVAELDGNMLSPEGGRRWGAALRS